MKDIEKLFIGFTKAAEYVELHRVGLITLKLVPIGIKIEISNISGEKFLTNTRYISYGSLQHYRGDIFSLIKMEIDQALKMAREAKT